MNQMRERVSAAKDTRQLMGYEGIAARLYFKELGSIVPEEFSFCRRSKRPPKDPYNALISFGYSIISNELYGKLESKGLNPYFGILHTDKEHHPSLVSDLMEEWRAILVDSVALAMLSRHELREEHFSKCEEDSGITISKDGVTRFIARLEEKMRTPNRYLNYIDHEVTFRKAMDIQIDALIRSMNEEDPMIYCPIKIR